MAEAPSPMGFRAQIRELLRQEPVVLARVTERTLPKFDASLSELSQASGMLPVTGNPEETNADWLAATRGIWVFGQKEMDFANPENASGFVSLYAPEHAETINDWLVKRGMRAYDPGALVELSSFAKDQPGSQEIELSANRQALAKVFMDDEFKDVRAVTVWADHGESNSVDPGMVAEMKKLGGWPLGSLRYDPGETVDSTCFLITRRQFMDALTGVRTGSAKPPVPQVA